MQSIPKYDEFAVETETSASSACCCSGSFAEASASHPSVCMRLSPFHAHQEKHLQTLFVSIIVYVIFYHVLSFTCFWSCGLESFERSCKHQALHKALLRPIATQLGTTHLRYPSLWDLEEAPKHPRASPGRSSFAFG